MAYCDAAHLNYVFAVPTNATLRADPAIVAVADDCVIYPLLSGPETMIVWTTKGMAALADLFISRAVRLHIYGPIMAANL